MSDHNQHQIINHNKAKAIVLGVLMLVLLLALLIGNNNSEKLGFPIPAIDSVDSTK